MQRNILLSYLFFIAILALACGSSEKRLLSTTTYVTSPDRGYTVTDHCDSKLNRQDLYTSYGLDGTIPHGGTVSSAFNMDT